MKHLKLILKTLINNSACVETARTKEKKYTIVAIVFALLALFFAVLPTAVTGFKQQGSAWLDTGYTSNLDKAWKDFGNSARTSNLRIYINGEHKLEYYDWNERYRDTSAFVRDKDGNVVADAKYDLKELSRYVYRDKLIPNDEKSLVEFVEIYAFDEPDDLVQEKVRQLLANENPYSISEDDKYLQLQEDENGVFQKVERSTSLMVFGRNTFYCYLFIPGNATCKASYYGNYTYIACDLIKFITNEDGNATDQEIINNLRELSNLGYMEIRFNNTWRQTGIILGIDAGIVLFMGLMVFVLTRGRNNPYRIFTFWEAQKISYYAALTPGILALLGFLIPNLAMMMFILGAGVRVMWLNMRTLNYKSTSTPKQ